MNLLVKAKTQRSSQVRISVRWPILTVNHFQLKGCQKNVGARVFAKVYKPLPVDVGHAPYISQATVDLASHVVGICISITGFDNLPQRWCCDCCLASTHSSVTWI